MGCGNSKSAETGTDGSTAPKSKDEQAPAGSTQQTSEKTPSAETGKETNGVSKPAVEDGSGVTQIISSSSEDQKTTPSTEVLENGSGENKDVREEKAADSPKENEAPAADQAVHVELVGKSNQDGGASKDSADAPHEDAASSGRAPAQQEEAPPASDPVPE